MFQRNSSKSAVQTKTESKRLVLIARVSTVRQAEDGYSLDAQRAKAHAWCKACGYELVELAAGYRPVSGAADKRQDLDAALAMVANGEACGIISSRLDRIARSVHQLTRVSTALNELGGDLVVIDQAIDTTTPAGKLMFHVLGAVAEFERDLISERTKEGMAQLIREGKRGAGRIPYGWKLRGGHVVEVVAEQQVIRQIGELRDAGMTYEEVAVALNKDNVPNRSGLWHKEHVRRIVLRAAS